MVNVLRKYDFEIGMMIPEYMDTYKVHIMALYLEKYKQIFQRVQTQFQTITFNFTPASLLFVIANRPRPCTMLMSWL
jgi:hypothetical protein